MPLLCRFAKPLGRFDKVFGNTSPFVVATAEVALCLGMSLFYGLAEPFDRLGGVFLNALSGNVAHTEVGLRFGVAAAATRSKSCAVAAPDFPISPIEAAALLAGLMTSPTFNFRVYPNISSILSCWLGGFLVM
jgi:hypothetical protein